MFPRPFVYRLPESPQRTRSIRRSCSGSFGEKPSTGYIVDLHDTLHPDTNLSEAEIKDVEEVLDADPLVTPEVLQITQWVSEYYAAPWGEVIKAALPPGISASIEQFLKITPQGLTHLETLSPHQTIRQSGRAH